MPTERHRAKLNARGPRVHHDQAIREVKNRAAGQSPNPGFARPTSSLFPLTWRGLFWYYSVPNVIRSTSLQQWDAKSECNHWLWHVKYIIFRFFGLCRRKEIKSRSKAEYLFGLAPCLAAIQANRRDIFEIYFRESGAQNTERYVDCF